MNNLIKIFKGMKTLLNNIEAVKRPETKFKYQDKLKKQMDAALEKQKIANLLLEERRQRKEQ